jgi:PAS domain S-box-containing protein
MDAVKRKSVESALRHTSEELRRTVALLRASEERYRLISDNVVDVIWTADLNLSHSELIKLKTNPAAVIDAVLGRWRFSYVSPSAMRLFGYLPDEIPHKSLLDITTTASHGKIREAMNEAFSMAPPPAGPNNPQHVLTLEFLNKDGSTRWCEVASTYLRDGEGIPTGMLGITRDISERRKAEQALCESENLLRSLFENLPDFVIMVDRKGIIRFTNRILQPDTPQPKPGDCSFDMIAPEYQEICHRVLDLAFSTGQPQSASGKDVFGHWWSSRIVALPKEDNSSPDRAMIICTDINQERLAVETVEKEQRLLRQLLELHERERRLIAYEIHDGFAQQLTGALFRLQGFRQAHARDPEASWESFYMAKRLISRAIDETRRLISGLRPPILDESGIVEAIEYLVCEHRCRNEPAIEFFHDITQKRFTPPLESAMFRIVQESLQNACRHSRSEKIRIELAQRDGRIFIDVRDWGVGFCVDSVEEQRFGLQGIRERVRLLDGRVVIDSSPGKGTHVAVQLPIVGHSSASAEAEESAAEEPSP